MFQPTKLNVSHASEEERLAPARAPPAATTNRVPARCTNALTPAPLPPGDSASAVPGGGAGSGAAPEAPLAPPERLAMPAVAPPSLPTGAPAPDCAAVGAASAASASSAASSASAGPARAARRIAARAAEHITRQRKRSCSAQLRARRSPPRARSGSAHVRRSAAGLGRRAHAPGGVPRLSLRSPARPLRCAAAARARLRRARPGRRRCARIWMCGCARLGALNRRTTAHGTGPKSTCGKGPASRRHNRLCPPPLRAPDAGSRARHGAHEDATRHRRRSPPAAAAAAEMGIARVASRCSAAALALLLFAGSALAAPAPGAPPCPKVTFTVADVVRRARTRKHALAPSRCARRCTSRAAMHPASWRHGGATAPPHC